MATPAAQHMGQIVSRISSDLKQAGFRKHRHTFNRSPETGLVHVLSFQMGPYEPPGTVPIAGLRENMYGLFTINFGIYLSELGRAFDQLPQTEVVHEYHCEIRGRAGQLAMGDKEWWLSLSADIGEVAAETKQLLTGELLPFLDALPSRRALLDAWFRGDLEAFMSPRSPLAMAIVLKHIGETEAARRLATDYLARASHEVGHIEWARESARKMGLV